MNLLDVTGPDEYHKRVNNNACANRMVLETFRIALLVMERPELAHAEFLSGLLDRLCFHDVCAALPSLVKELYVPVPDRESGVAPPFDDYEKLENVLLPGLKSRLLNPSEYLGARLPKVWKNLRFGIYWRGMRFQVSIGRGEVRIESDPGNRAEAVWRVRGQGLRCSPGEVAISNLPQPSPAGEKRAPGHPSGKSGLALAGFPIGEGPRIAVQKEKAPTPS